MTSEIERFQNAVRNSAELKKAVQSTSSPEELVTLAASRGFEFSAPELDGYAKQRQTELSDRDLEGAVGGLGTYGTGNVSVWSWIKGQMFGVDPSFY